ncbi:MAG: SDR family NAD(P)-dependent oxidoreductase [Acidobacteria bacterium]|nr:SDR family NAD(P)-dependent oxidoreductase [Acidobacteriota bacterium]
MNIQGKRAVVTGGASGLGGACTRMIMAAGGEVVAVDLNDAAGAAIAAETGCTYVKADVSDAQQMESVFAQAGDVRILVNCAGIVLSQRVVARDNSAAPLADFDRVIRVNLVGTYNSIRLAASSMARSGEGGVIVNTASIAAFDGQIGQSAYAASKGGVVGMTLPLARDLAKIGVRVMTVAPGLFDTPMMASLPVEVKQTMAAGVPNPSRLGDPAEFAALVRHIIENDMLNGEVIRLDGALRMPPK